MPVFGGKVAGSSHTAGGLPCQDAFHFDIIDKEEIIVAVADGLGSAKYSDTGARIAVESAVDKIKSVFDLNGPYEIPLCDMMKNRDIVKEAFYYARESLDEYSKEEGIPLNMLACTLLVAFTYKGSVTTGHIGDGAIVAGIKEEITIISLPAKSEYVNEVTPITSDKFNDNLRINENITGVEIFALFTDGCQRAFLQKKDDRYIPFEPFFRPFFSYAKRLSDNDKAAEEITDFLASEKMTENSDDDKTLIIAVIDKGEI